MKIALFLVCWCLLFLLCWPLALLVLLLAPLLWLLLLPFRLACMAVEAVLLLVKTLLFLPARILGRLSS